MIGVTSEEIHDLWRRVLEVGLRLVVAIGKSVFDFLSYIDMRATIDDFVFVLIVSEKDR